MWISKSNEALPRLIFILDKQNSFDDEECLGKLNYRVVSSAKIVKQKKTSNESICIIQLNDIKYCKQFYYFLETFFYEKKLMRFQSQGVIKEYIQKWEEFFDSENILSLNEQIGLWGELFFINKFSIPGKIIEKWHGPENKKFDFLTAKEGIDVKTSTAGSVHHFSYGQIKPSHPAFFLSLFIAPDPAGVNLEQLIKAITRKTHNKGCFFRRLIKSRLFQASYDKTRYSLISQRFLNAENIPQPRLIDPGVEDLHFKCDVSAALPESKKIQQLVFSRLSQ